MAKLVYSYHNKKHSVTTFKALYENKYNHRKYFFVDVDGHKGMIEYMNRLLRYTKRPGPDYVKISNFSYAKSLLDAHNAKMRSMMETCNKSIEVEQVLHDGSKEFMKMPDVLSQAFITYQGQTF